MDLADALAAARVHHQVVLVTIRSSDGRPQLSNVLQHTDDAGTVRISTTADRAKYHNLRRDPWAAIHLDAGSFWSYAVLEGEVEVSDVASDVGDATVEELVGLYRDLSGEHEDWAAYRAAMVADRRVVVRLHPTRAYGLLR